MSPAVGQDFDEILEPCRGLGANGIDSWTISWGKHAEVNVYNFRNYQRLGASAEDERKGVLGFCTLILAVDSSHTAHCTSQKSIDEE